MWLGFAHFHNGYSFLMISPNLHDIWPLFLLIPSRYETAHLLTLLRLPGDGYDGQQKIASAAHLSYLKLRKINPSVIGKYAIGPCSAFAN
jgi:hypothetical protein